MLLAARLREALGVPGLERGADRAVPQQGGDEAGAGYRRNPHAAPPAGGGEAAIRAAAERIGFPLILKPIDGAGSADTHRVDDAERARRSASSESGTSRSSRSRSSSTARSTPSTRCRSTDTRPTTTSPGTGRVRSRRASQEWISPQVIALREPGPARARGRASKWASRCCARSDSSTGFTHMEWYLKADGEVVFGEIGGRPPGAHQVDQMNYACDIDVFRGWADAVCCGRFREQVRRLYNVATIYKRAAGRGPDPTHRGPRGLQGQARRGDSSGRICCRWARRAATGSRPWSPTVS